MKYIVKIYSKPVIDKIVQADQFEAVTFTGGFTRRYSK